MLCYRVIADCLGILHNLKMTNLCLSLKCAFYSYWSVCCFSTSIELTSDIPKVQRNCLATHAAILTSCFIMVDILFFRLMQTLPSFKTLTSGKGQRFFCRVPLRWSELRDFPPAFTYSFKMVCQPMCNEVFSMLTFQLMPRKGKINNSVNWGLWKSQKAVSVIYPQISES